MKKLTLVFILSLTPWVHADLMEDARAHYTQQNFEAFFGLAQWVRLAQPQDLKSEDRDQLLALELMGLARHCRWKDVLLLKEEVRGPFALKALELIEVKSEYQRFAADPRNRKFSVEKAVVHSREHWKVTPEKMKSFLAPKNLRAKVRSQCASS